MNKLTLEQREKIFKNIPPAYNYAAKDFDGRWYCYLEEPKIIGNLWAWWHKSALRIDAAAYGIKIHWKDSLITRP